MNRNIDLTENGDFTFDTKVKGYGVEETFEIMGIEIPAINAEYCYLPWKFNGFFNDKDCIDIMSEHKNRESDYCENCGVKINVYETNSYGLCWKCRDVELELDISSKNIWLK